MKKSLLSLSITAMIGGLTLAGGAAIAATSVPGSGVYSATTATLTNTDTLQIQQSGIGHINVVPYFTTQNGNQTLLSITNTDTVNGKLVKVRFRSAYNSDDVFDFTLFLSPQDVWTANVSRGANGLSTLTTTDVSCTLPTNVSQQFVTARITPTGLTGDTLASLTREGYIEVLNTANIPAGTALFTATKHVNGVAPCTAATLNALLADLQTEAQLAGAGLDTPSGGLYTSAFIINTQNAFLSWSTESTAIAAVTAATRVPGRGRIVFSPQTADVATFPAGSSIAALSGDPLLGGGTRFSGAAAPAGSAIVAAQFDFPDLSTPYTGVTAPGALTAASADTQANLLGAALAVSAIRNEYTTLAAIGAKTDLTFSMPTRRYGVAVDYAFAAGNDRLVFNLGNNYFSTANTSLVNGNLACVSPGGIAGSQVIAYDREERGGTTGSPAVISPGTPGQALTFCGEVSVLTLNNVAGPGVLGGQILVKDISTGFAEGWVNILTPGLGGTVGLPILGSSYSSARGPVVTGTSTNFGWTFRHKTTPVTY